MDSSSAFRLSSSEQSSGYPFVDGQGVRPAAEIIGGCPDGKRSGIHKFDTVIEELTGYGDRGILDFVNENFGVVCYG